MPSDGKKYWLDGGVRFLVWITPDNPKVVHLTTNDPRLVQPDGSGGVGLHLVDNDYPKSANFRPITVVKVLEAMRRQGDIPGLPPADEIFVADRHLDKRPGVIAAYEQFNEPKQHVQVAFDVPSSRVAELRDRLREISDEFEFEGI